MKARFPYAVPFHMPRRTLGEQLRVQSQGVSEIGDRLMGASIRDNILFSHEYDETFYNLVLDGAYDPSRPWHFCIHLPSDSMRASSRLGTPA